MELPITIDQTQNKTIKEAYLTDLAVPNSHSPNSAITEKVQKYTEDLAGI
jgi:hypothetical protein